MVETGHYVGILVDGRKPGVSRGVTLDRLAQEFVDQGCVTAYNLDGGQSTAMVFMGEQLNTHQGETTNGQRRIPDMLILWLLPPYAGPGDRIIPIRYRQHLPYAMRCYTP